MDALIDLMNHPYLTYKLAFNDDGSRNFDAKLPLTICFAFGIWLVYERYQRMHNSPIPFDFAIPEVLLAFIPCHRSDGCVASGPGV